MGCPNVLLLVMDAVRVDHVSAYGYDRPTTPAVEDLADESVVFEHAFANSNWTGTSHGTMFTGLLPSHSGIYGENPALPQECTTLPEALKRGGYRTFSASAGAHIRSSRGYDRGIDEFVEAYKVPDPKPSRAFFGRVFSDSALRRDALATLRDGPDGNTRYKFHRLIQWIDEDDEQPFFAFLNCKCPHNPYDPPRPYKRMFCSELQRPRYHVLEYLRRGLGLTDQRVRGYDTQKLRALSEDFPHMGEGVDVSPEEWEVVKSWYDGAIRYLDDWLDRLVSFLRECGRFDDTAIIVTADHGEMFGEHGLTKHDFSLYDELLHVPLIIKPPLSASVDVPQRPSGLTSLVDLYPTVLSLGGQSVPDYPYARNLLNDPDAGHEHVFAELGVKPTHHITRRHPEFDGSEYNGPMQAVRDDRYKLIVSDDRVELYDWRADPAEQEDLSEKQPDVVARLRDVLDEALSDLNESETDEEIEDERLEQQLKDLGYM